jgi:hypothetical protein
MDCDTMKKAVTGGMLWTIIIIVIGILGIALLWLFLNKAGTSIAEQFDNLVEGFKGAMCKMIGGLAGWVLGC